MVSLSQAKFQLFPKMKTYKGITAEKWFDIARQLAYYRNDPQAWEYLKKYYKIKKPRGTDVRVLAFMDGLSQGCKYERYLLSINSKKFVVNYDEDLIDYYNDETDSIEYEKVEKYSIEKYTGGLWWDYRFD